MELYKKVRLACAEGMSARAAAMHFNISRGTVKKMLAFSVPPGYRREKPMKGNVPVDVELRGVKGGVALSEP